MKDKEIKRLIREYMKWWVRHTGAGFWRVNMRWEEVIEWEDGHLDTAAFCTCDWKYEEATITFALSRLRNLKKWEIESAVVHEIMHIFLNETREKGIEHEERIATQLAKAFIWVRDAKK